MEVPMKRSVHHSRMIQGTSPDQTNNILMRNWNLYNLFKIISIVGIILCVCTIGNDKNLNIFIQSASRPERIPLVAVDLIECFTDSNSSAFQLNMHICLNIF